MEEFERHPHALSIIHHRNVVDDPEREYSLTVGLYTLRPLDGPATIWAAIEEGPTYYDAARREGRIELDELKRQIERAVVISDRPIEVPVKQYGCMTGWTLAGCHNIPEGTIALEATDARALLSALSL